MTELASGKLLLEQPTAGVARLTIRNPERRGALDHELLDAIADTVRGLDARCLVVAGSGPIFSAGYDIGQLEGARLAEAAEKLVAHPFHAALEILDAYRYPTVAQVNGHAIGGGLELVLTCDIRVAARDVDLWMPPAKLGLIYSHTGLRKFLDACGPANTAELFYLARRVDADRGCEMGLVNQVVPPEELEEHVLEIATEIAANAPLSLSGNKRIVRALRDTPHELPAELERELVALRRSCFTSEDFHEGVRAFAQKRAPVWRGR